MIASTDNSDDLWPPIIEDLPEVDLAMESLHGRMLVSGEFRILLMYAESEVVVPTHHHGAQWGMVLAGSMELTIGDDTQTYHRGDTHYIPPHVDHGAVLHAGWRGLYLFKSKDA